MNKRIKQIIFIICMAFANQGFSQFYFLNDSYENLELDFLKHKIEVSANETFFNLVKIKNPTNRKVSFIANFSYPANWTFIGLNNQRIDLNPNDSILLPFRASPAISSKGDIGYAIVASISDLSGNLIKNKYSFINVPRIKNVMFKPQTRLLYMHPGKKKTDMQIKIKNNGNTDENFYLEFFFNNTLATEGSVDNYFQDEVFLKPFSDTTYTLPIHLVPDANIYNKNYHRTKLKVSTVDTSYQSSVWVKELDYKTINKVPDAYKMLSVELRLQNLFAETKPQPSVYAFGNLLFKKDHTINYYFQTYNSNFTKDPYKNSRFLVKYIKAGFVAEVGDVSSNFYQNIFGRGLALSFKKNKTGVRAIANKLIQSEQYNAGIALQQNITKLGTIEGGYSLSQNNEQKASSHVSFLKYSTNLKKLGSISITALNSLFDANFLSDDKMGFGGLLTYNNNFKNTNINLNARYFDNNFSSNENGRTNVNLNVFHKLNQGRFLTAYYMLNNYGTQSLYDTITTQRQYTNMQETRVLYNQLLKNNITFAIGPNYITNEANKFYYTLEQPFFTHNYYVHSTLKYRSKNARTFMSLRVRPGVTQVSNNFHEYDTLSTHKLWFNANIAANINSNIWGFYLSYFHGPYSVSQQHQYHISNYYSKTLQFMPYLDLFVIKKYLRFTSRLNYTYNITSKVNRINLTGELTGYIGQTWELGFVGNLSYQSNIDLITEQKESYSATFFEVRLRKDFLINQPRYQYHDLELVFFKDLDGNRIKSDDEPGVKNVLFSIKQDERADLQNQQHTGAYFNQLELLSDLKGRVIYKNIPNGFYIIEYHPIGDVKGAFASETSIQNIRIDKNRKIYIPFLENNKIFGKIVLKRSKLSNLGSISLGNIKVTAEDTRGKKYSTLTDNDGNFLIYVPNVDKYKVKVNNIFYENFELEQNNYEVQLNGYRQFEINFIFKEKKRKINFASNYEYNFEKDNDQSIEIVRRTSLSGVVKDATTLKPLKAKVRVVNKEGKEITSANTNMRTGNYSLMFVAGDNYSIEVSSDDYWFFSESLYNNQIITFKNIDKDVLLKAITIGSIIPMKTLQFESGKSQIPITSFPELERLMKVLHKNRNVKVMVHGHADDLEVLESGSTDLSLERAKNIAKYLIANGYNRVSYIGHQNTKPISNNDTEDGRKQNRRVEIVVTGK